MDPWIVLVPILVADLLNPVLLAAVIFEFGSRWAWRERADEPLRRFSTRIERISEVAMPCILFALAACFIVDGAAFFLLDRPFFEL